jgi:hypothetical protein
MANCSEHKNPLKNNGTSQVQRLLPALDKSQWALADEKDFARWIVFAGEFSSFIKYYNSANSIAGDWKPFFSNDIAAQLGSIAVQNIDSYKEEIKERFDYIKDDENQPFLPVIQTRLNDLFSAILTLSLALDEYVLSLPAKTKLKDTITNLIQTKLSTDLYRLLGYFKAAGPAKHNLLKAGPFNGWRILNKKVEDAGVIISGQGLSSNWWIIQSGSSLLNYEWVKNNKSKVANADTLLSSITKWNEFTGTVIDDDSIFNNPNPSVGFDNDFLSIEHAAHHNLFTGIFDSYLTAYSKIILDSEAELLKTLESYDEHAPHYALFLSFLKLFRFTQNHLNTITQRHLDFYYKEVLRLQPRAAEANKVHVLGVLAKQADSYLLAQGTALKAGKDSLKKDVSYTLDNDAVFNKAAIKQLKTFYKGSSGDTIFIPGTKTKMQDNAGRVFASPVTNSDDGNGAALTSASKEWQPYVHKVYKESELESIAMPEARIGFALASHYLYLTEGERKVFVRFVMYKNGKPDNTSLNGRKIECYLTAEKEWYKAETITIGSSGKKLSGTNTECTEISFTIPGSAPAIINYNAAVHGGTYNVSLPLLRIYLVNDDSHVYEYDFLKDITITKTEIRVEVGMDESVSKQNGLKNLLFSNDFGVLDASKPFTPYGTRPTAGNRLVIGHKEIFAKKNTNLKLNLEWKDLPADRADISFVNPGSFNYPKISINNLERGIWKILKPSDELFEDIGTSGVKTTRQISLTGYSIDNSLVDYAKEYPDYNISSSKGFIALQLKQSFGHKEHLVTFADYLVRKANSITTDDITLPVEPYIPTLQSVYASYSAYCINDLSDGNEIKFNSREIKFFHIYPFGEGEQHKYLTPAENIYLLPQFKHAAKGITVQHVGEFYIGIENLNPQESVNILFQVMEGTTNPTIAKPENHIHWSYLGNNNWIDLKTSAYSDNTLELVQSGIISFAVPSDATKGNTMLPKGYIWLRAAVAEAAEAVCELISADAQAAVATFTNNDNADDFLDAALPSGKVTKLKVPVASVKKIDQPYASFGGRPKENEDHFYIRVSERLRHKDRAITVWDYEHLVLEKFPEIYKVKCLNHTQIDNGIYDEVKPGYVRIITIPSLQNRNEANPLKPYTQQSTLTKIEKYLSSRISCFVNLRACQPQFEEVRIEFSLKLHKQYKDFTFYANQLKDEITQFLCPWAYGSNAKIDFGGKVYKSVLINFIEERYYVDFITDVFLYVKVNETTKQSGNMDEITASTARSILVSVPASKHTIHEIKEDAELQQNECAGITISRAE